MPGMDDETRAEIRAAVAEAIAAAQPSETIVIEPTPVADTIAVEAAYQEGRTETEVAVIEAQADAAVAVIEAQAAAEVEVIEALADAAADDEPAGDALDLDAGGDGDVPPLIEPEAEPTPEHWLFRPIGKK